MLRPHRTRYAPRKSDKPSMSTTSSGDNTWGFNKELLSGDRQVPRPGQWPGLRLVAQWVVLCQSRWGLGRPPEGAAAGRWGFSTVGGSDFAYKATTTGIQVGRRSPQAEETGDQSPRPWVGIMGILQRLRAAAGIIL